MPAYHSRTSNGTCVRLHPTSYCKKQRTVLPELVLPNFHRALAHTVVKTQTLQYAVAIDHQTRTLRQVTEFATPAVAIDIMCRWASHVVEWLCREPRVVVQTCNI
jgi:hypothetical protein